MTISKWAGVVLKRTVGLTRRFDQYALIVFWRRFQKRKMFRLGQNLLLWNTTLLVRARCLGPLQSRQLGARSGADPGFYKWGGAWLFFFQNERPRHPKAAFVFCTKCPLSLVLSMGKLFLLNRLLNKGILFKKKEIKCRSALMCRVKFHGSAYPKQRTCLALTETVNSELTSSVFHG